MIKLQPKTIKIIANATAGVVLAGALVYYNFFDKPVAFEVGQLCPDFTVNTFALNEKDEFYLSDNYKTLSSSNGKICVINFWEVWCSSCVKELPHFDEMYKNYSDKVDVIAVVGNTFTPDGVADWMNNEGYKKYHAESDWTTFSLTFGIQPNEDLCNKLGGGGMLPRTVILDERGIVLYETDASMDYESLTGLIDGFIK